MSDTPAEMPAQVGGFEVANRGPSDDGPLSDIGEAIILGNRIVTMTAGPAARIKTIATVDLPYPRDLTDPAAVRLQRRLRDDIGAEVTRTLIAQGMTTEQVA